MRVLSVHNRYQQPGGEDAVFEAEAAVLEQHGHAVHRLVFDNSEIGDHLSPMESLRLAGTAIWSRSAASRIRCAIRESRADVAHFHNTFPLVSPAAFGACRREGVAVVHTLHNYRLMCPSATLFRDGQVCEDCVGPAVAWPGVLHACYRGSRTQTATVAAMLAVHRLRKTWWRDVDLFIALTEFSRRKFIEGGLPGDRVAVKPNFLPVDPGLHTEDRRGFLFAGRLVEEKGVRALLDAWQHARIDATLRIAGDGPLAPEVRRAALQQQSVQYLGGIRREAVLQEMARAVALVFPSAWYEAFPVAIVEAFASGLPVIAPRIGVMPEIINDHRTGLIYEPSNVRALGDTLAWAHEHEQELTRMSYECRREYESRYTASENCARLIRLYETALRTSRAATR
jgi:glycosyltransferase involved in cell wall biosynthesis